jgi:tripartite-type tricarboxylate transporter receptor subunit TctC
MERRQRIVSGLILSLMWLGDPNTSDAAQPAIKYPERPIRLIVPYPPGGTADVMARIIGLKLADNWNRTVVIDNRGGAGGNIATEIVARAEPDGYTLLLCNAPVLAINPTLYKKVPFDPVKDFAPVGTIAEVPLFLVVHPSVPAKNFTEFLAYVKSRSGTINYASGSVGSTTHLAAELFKTMANVQMNHIPYKGSGPALAAMAAGEVTIMFELMPSAMPFVKGDRLRALAVTSGKRSPLMPALPTIAETGLPGYEVASWFALCAPAGVPKVVIAKLNGELVGIVKAPEMQERLSKLGAQPRTMTPVAFGSFIKAEIMKWSKVVRDSGAKLD